MKARAKKGDLAVVLYSKKGRIGRLVNVLSDPFMARTDYCAGRVLVNEIDEQTGLRYPRNYVIRSEWLLPIQRGISNSAKRVTARATLVKVHP